jgi:hypothetical protein
MSILEWFKSISVTSIKTLIALEIFSSSPSGVKLFNFNELGCVVRRSGLEPPCPFGRQPLKLVRLPISPPAHLSVENNAEETEFRPRQIVPVNHDAAGASFPFGQVKRNSGCSLQFP